MKYIKYLAILCLVMSGCGKVVEIPSGHKGKVFTSIGNALAAYRAAEGGV